LQRSIHVSERLRSYVLDLGRATWRPADFGITLPELETEEWIEAGVSPRGLSHLVRVARVRAWLEGRDRVEPEDVQTVFAAVIGHRIFLKPVFEYRRNELLPELVDRILRHIAAP
jgi:MoxR-like ATPase